ncbi:helix-turn-helix domain-containing protein [Neptunicella sp.]|uniref:helix-turn-helix domain-containing protein n=1 Tax=Neptunicella sp. TaxID=2125986 RepID=UPI003F68C99B
MQFYEAKLKKHGSQLNRSLIDGIEVLQGLASFERPVGCRELARYLELDITRVNRLLRTLAFVGFARQTDDRKYTTGPAMLVLAAQGLFASGATSKAIKPLEELRVYGLVVAMGVLWHDKVTYLYHSLPDMGSESPLGRLGYFPATECGVGMSLLSELEDEEIIHLYADKEIPGYPDGIDSLLQNIQQIRAQQFVRMETHYKTHLPHHSVTIAVNVKGSMHSAIALSGWIPDAATDELVDTLNRIAKDIEELSD